MNNLNPQQQAAVEHISGCELILAGAGTGKTKTLISKIENILNNSSLSAKNILILTFSKKAAAEIKERALKNLGDQANNLTSGTFHSICLKILKENKNDFLKNSGYTKFPELLTEEKTIIFYINCLKELKEKTLGIPYLYFLNYIQKEEPNKFPPEVKELLTLAKEQIAKEKIKQNLIEFEDLIDYATSLLLQNKNLKKKYQQLYKYILVDEFQDTSTNNFLFMKTLLPEKKCNLFLVGDDWQSIYAFRNAQVKYIIQAKEYFPEIKIYNLGINYRCKAEIVDISNKLISRNKFRTNKKITSYQGKGGNISYYIALNLAQEKEIIHNLINELIKKNEKDIALLCRNNRELENIGYPLQRYFKLERNFEIFCMTIHASKGLEFNSVILFGIDDSIFPAKETPIEEERRLLYVGLTRAKNNLLLVARSDNKLPFFAKELKFPKKRRVNHIKS